MLYSVILSVDIGVASRDELVEYYGDVDLDNVIKSKQDDALCYWRPSLPEDDMWQTEGHDQYEYSYLEGGWEVGAHGKWVGVLSQEQFDTLVDEYSLVAEDVETMGSLGAPGVGWLAPAISFNNDDVHDAVIRAYVTPFPSREKKSDSPASAGAWRRLRRAVINKYGRWA